MNIDSDTFEQVWLFESQSRPGHKHIVIRSGNHWLCSCEDFQFTPELQPLCKHISRIISDKLDWPLDSRGRLVSAGT